jgi:hypothetical protein
MLDCWAEIVPDSFTPSLNAAVLGYSVSLETSLPLKGKSYGR